MIGSSCGMIGGSCGMPVEKTKFKQGGCGMVGGESGSDSDSDSGNNDTYGGAIKKRYKKNLKNKKTTTKKTKKSMKGGSSDWLASQYSRGPSNYSDIGQNSGQKLFGNFADPSLYVSNNDLRHPKPMEATNQICGSKSYQEYGNYSPYI